MPCKPKAAVGSTFIKTTVVVEGRTEERVVELPAFTPPTWTADTPLSVVGARVPRADALER